MMESAVADLALEAAEDRVVLEQVGQSGGVGDVVDGHELQGRVAGGGPDHVAADAPEPVDADLDGHMKPPMDICGEPRKYRLKYHELGNS
jgi:hypothetical protein